MRALENGRYLLRSTNNGITAIVDHRGQMVASLPRFEQDVLRGSVLVMAGQTLYSRLGGLPVVLGCFSILIIGLWLRHRRVRGDAGQA